MKKLLVTLLTAVSLAFSAGAIAQPAAEPAKMEAKAEEAKVAPAPSAAPAAEAKKAADTPAAHKARGPAAETEIGLVSPVNQVVASFSAGLAPVGNFIATKTGLAQSLAGSSIHPIGVLFGRQLDFAAFDLGKQVSPGLERELVNGKVIGLQG